MQISEIPEGRYCRDDGTYMCKFLVYEAEEEEVFDWCSMYECYIWDDRKCAPCAHPEI